MMASFKLKLQLGMFLLITKLFYYRDQETQTKTDASTNVPRPQVFLAGLRGGGMSTATRMVKVDLTQDVDQT